VGFFHLWMIKNLVLSPRALDDPCFFARIQETGRKTCPKRLLLDVFEAEDKICESTWKRASKFQKELSTYWFVGISSKPISRKVYRNSSRTLDKGWIAPTFKGTPEIKMEKRTFGVQIVGFKVEIFPGS
jgi:hypothetical protein